MILERQLVCLCGKGGVTLVKAYPKLFTLALKKEHSVLDHLPSIRISKFQYLESVFKAALK